MQMNIDMVKLGADGSSQSLKTCGALLRLLLDFSILPL
jgi:hypothetical protein